MSFPLDINGSVPIIIPSCDEESDYSEEEDCFTDETKAMIAIHESNYHEESGNQQELQHDTSNDNPPNSSSDKLPKLDSEKLQSYLNDLPVPLPVKTSAIMAFHERKRRTCPGLTQFRIDNFVSEKNNGDEAGKYFFEDYFNLKTSPRKDQKQKPVWELGNVKNDKKLKIGRKIRFVRNVVRPETSKTSDSENDADNDDDNNENDKDSDITSFNDNSRNILPSIQDLFPKSILDKVDPLVLKDGSLSNSSKRKIFKDSTGGARVAGRQFLPSPALLDSTNGISYNFPGIPVSFTRNLDMHFIKTNLPNFHGETTTKDNKYLSKSQALGDCNEFIQTLIVYLTNVHKTQKWKMCKIQEANIDSVILINSLMYDFFKKFGLIPLSKLKGVKEKEGGKFFEPNSNGYDKNSPFLNFSNKGLTKQVQSSTSSSGITLSDEFMFTNLENQRVSQADSLLGNNNPDTISTNDLPYNNDFVLQIKFFIDGPPFEIFGKMFCNRKKINSRKLYSFVVSLQFTRLTSAIGSNSDSNGIANSNPADIQKERTDGTFEDKANDKQPERLFNVSEYRSDFTKKVVLSNIDFTKKIIALLNGPTTPVKAKSIEEAATVEKSIRETRSKILKLLKKNQILLHDLKVEMVVSNL